MVEELRRSLHRVVNVYAPPPSLPLSLPLSLTALLSTRPEAVLTKFDYMEVWWKAADAGGDGEDGGGGETVGTGAFRRDVESPHTSCHSRQENRKAYRPTPCCTPRVVLYAATVPGPLRMLLNVDTAQGDAPHSTTSYHIEYFEALVSQALPAQGGGGGGETADEGGSAGDGEQHRPIVSGVSVTLRPLSTPGRPQTKVGPQTIKEVFFDFVRNARGGKGGKGPGSAAVYEGGSVVAQSLEHLLLLMKGEPLPDEFAHPAYGEARDSTGSINIPTDVPLFVRLGVLENLDSAQVPKLVSKEWTMLEGSSPEWQLVHAAALNTPRPQPQPTPPLPNPGPTALPALLLAQGLAQRAGLADVAATLFPDYVRALAFISRPFPGDPPRPLGLRVVHSRLIRAVCLLLHVPQCMQHFLAEINEPVREMLVTHASQDVCAPLSHELDELTSKSAFLCQRLGPDSPSLVASMPRSNLTLLGARPPTALALSYLVPAGGGGGGGGRSISGLQGVGGLIQGEGVEENVDSEVGEFAHAGGGGGRGRKQAEIKGKGSVDGGGAGGAEEEDGAGDVDDGEDDDGRIEEMMTTLFSNTPVEEQLLIEPMAFEDTQKVRMPASYWYKKIGRLRLTRLLEEACRTEDAIAIYHARLALLTLLHTAPKGSLPLDVDTLATLLRRLFRTIKPDLSSVVWRERMRKVLDSQLLGLATDLPRPAYAEGVAATTNMGARNVETLTRHCRALLESLARASREHGARILSGGGVEAGVAGAGGVGGRGDGIGGCRGDAVAAAMPAVNVLRTMRVCIESRHNYAPHTHLAVRVRVPQAAGLRVSLDSRCETKRDRDRLMLYTDALLKNQVGCFHGPSGAGNWAPPPDIKCNSLVVVFETDSGPGEWGFRLYLQSLDESGLAVSVGNVVFESVPAYTQGLRGKQDISLHPEDVDCGDNALRVEFDPDGCSLTSAQSSRSANEGGRLKFISPRGKQVYVAGCRWEPLSLGLTRFTLDCKGPPTGRLEYRFTASLRVCEPLHGGGWGEGGDTGTGDMEGENVSCALMADFQFVCWLMSTLSSPTNGLLGSSGLAPSIMYEHLRSLVECGLGAISSIPAPARLLLLRSISISVRGLRAAAEELHGVGGVGDKGSGLDKCATPAWKAKRDLSPQAFASVRVLREAAIAQHAVELPQVGSQRAHFSPGLQALVEVVSLLDCGPAEHFSAMSRHELIRAIESVDGPPGTALCKALLDANDEQVRWCLCRGAKAEEACGERLVGSYAMPHYALHYAALGGRASLVHLLVDRQADVHSMDGGGNQALAWAAEAGLPATVEALLQRGADWRHRNLLGHSALDLAVQAQAAASSRPKGAAPETGAKKSDFKAVMNLLQAQLLLTAPYKLTGLVMAVEGGHGLPSLNGPTLLPGMPVFLRAFCLLVGLFLGLF
jgi:hypothetical protein